MEIRFTKHAREKFIVLERHGVRISRQKVVSTVATPALIDHSRLPLLIAQSNLDAEHVLRVVFRKEERVIVIITFYPGRKSHYEKD